MWLVSVLVTAMTATVLQRWMSAVHPRLRTFAQPLLDRAGAKAGGPRLTDRQRLSRQLHTWRQAHPDYPATRTAPS